jgi:hypothetical protein
MIALLYFVQYSDHVAVSFLAERSKIGDAKKPAKWDKATRKCQPFKKQTRIGSFFKPVSESDSNAVSTTSAGGKRSSPSSTASVPKKKKANLLAFFSKKT